MNPKPLISGFEDLPEATKKKQSTKEAFIGEVGPVLPGIHLASLGSC